MKKLKKLLFEDLNQIESAGFPIALLLVLYGFFLASINQSYYDGIYTMRNGFICSLQQLFLFLMMVLSFYRASTGRPRNWRILYILTWVFFGFLFLFGFGEKIRWGQFIFSLDIPHYFQQYNTQGQITIHNLRFGDFSVNKVIFGSFLAIMVVLYTLILPFVYTRSKVIEKLVKTLGLPIARRTQIIWYIILVSIALLIPVPKKGELVQFAGVWSFMMFFFFPANKEDF